MATAGVAQSCDVLFVAVRQDEIRLVNDEHSDVLQVDRAGIEEGQ